MGTGDRGSWAWSGFLGADDEVLGPLFKEASRRLEDPASFDAWVRDAIGPRNIAGLADPAKRNLYPEEVGALLQNASLLGLAREEVEALLPRLRGKLTPLHPSHTLPRRGA